MIITIFLNLASVGFMATLTSEEKKLMATYPVFLFYLSLSWYSMII